MELTLGGKNKRQGLWVPAFAGTTKISEGRCALFTLPFQERVKSHTDAVVTPPSTTMVWPVMKLEASEPR